MSTIYSEDCRNAMQRPLSYDYVLTSPPDFDELGMVPQRDKGVYFDFLGECFALFNPDVPVTIVNTDRKSGGIIITKHSIITTLLHRRGYALCSQKIWVKSFKQNLYRLNYAFVQTFARGSAKVNRFDDAFGKDAWHIQCPKYSGYSYNFPPDLARRCIRNHTDEGAVVIDPFIGSGTTAGAALDEGRAFLGCEIDPVTHQLALARIAAHEGKENGPRRV